MKRLHWIVFTEVVALFAGLPPAQSGSKFEAKAEDNFKVNWSSVTYSKTVHNPELSPNIRIQKASQTLSLNCEVEILDPNLVLGMRWEPLIEEITNGKGEDIKTALVSSGSSRMQYERLNYRRRYVRPPKPARWKTAVRSVLRLPPKENPPGRWVEVLEPRRMQIHLDGGLIKQAGGEIGRVKGHFLALVAESLEYVEVPFKPSDWVRLTPDLEIQLHHTECTERKFGFHIGRRPEGSPSMRTLSVRDYLPDRVVVARELIVEDGKRSQHPLGIQRLPADILEGINGAGSDCLIKSIRFVIAVNPTHHEIPFVLEHVPFPKP